MQRDYDSLALSYADLEASFIEIPDILIKDAISLSKCLKTSKPVLQHLRIVGKFPLKFQGLLFCLMELRMTI
jgi:hypothetical protein